MLDSDLDAPLARVDATRGLSAVKSSSQGFSVGLIQMPVMSTAVCGQLLDALEEDLMWPGIPQKKRVKHVV